MAVLVRLNCDIGSLPYIIVTHHQVHAPISPQEDNICLVMRFTNIFWAWVYTSLGLVLTVLEHISLTAWCSGCLQCSCDSFEWATPVFPLQSGTTALMFASGLGHERVVETLLNAGATPDMQEKVLLYWTFCQLCSSWE